MGRSASHAVLTTLCNKLVEVIRDCQNARGREKRVQLLELPPKRAAVASTNRNEGSVSTLIRVECLLS
jgi:hypothetical protein